MSVYSLGLIDSIALGGVQYLGLIRWPRTILNSWGRFDGLRLNRISWLSRISRVELDGLWLNRLSGELGLNPLSRGARGVNRMSRWPVVESNIWVACG
jgi:hypothetical protein